jgi:hypothetical protein
VERQLGSLWLVRSPLVSTLLSRGCHRLPAEVSRVSPKKRFILFLVFLTCFSTAWAVPSAAQGFRGRRVVVRPVFVGGYYADPFWFGAYPWYPYAYQFGPYPPYPYYPYYGGDRGAAVRIEATPADAEVYVDGYYAGIVDDFDGVFQRLHAAPGAHEITLYREGYRTVRQKVYLTPDSTFKIRYTMEKLAAGEAGEPRPVPTTPPTPQPGTSPLPPRGPIGRRIPPPNVPPGPENQRTSDASTYGTLSIRVQPASANVVIDGEPWQGPQGQDRLVVEVTEGSHRVQIQKEGYEPFSADIQVRRGETTPLNISLRTRP